MKFIIQQPPCVIELIAYGEAHYWASQFREAGHEVEMISLHLLSPVMLALPPPPLAINEKTEFMVFKLTNATASLTKHIFAF